MDELLNEIGPTPTPEEEEEWERERKEREEAKIRPFREMHSQIVDHDELLAQSLYEITLLEFGMEG